MFKGSAVVRVFKTEATAALLALVVVLVGTADFPTNVHGMAAMGP